ncbi:response regulator transcription factor [Brackiella oedipodis]|uniref:response regulator transcription factor n=1 Tax=Brackiella oedipodis TaxID=124225 RepID=UPI00048E331A|nr:response regulator transcription factor [Brackiella oedipodis]
MQDTTRILIVEDHSALAANLQEFFSGKEYILDFAYDGLTALHLVATQAYDIVILDIMLPGVSGLDICRRLRDDLGSDVPVIIMTSKDQLDDKQQAFDLGVDDYLTKPFDLRELKMRIKALLRRQGGGHKKSQKLEGAGLVLDLNTFELSNDQGQQIEIKGLSANIFVSLIKAWPNFVSYRQLIDDVWGEQEVDMNTVRTHVYTLRKQIQDAFNYTCIRTLHGRGYRLMTREDSHEA